MGTETSQPAPQGGAAQQRQLLLPATATSGFSPPAVSSTEVPEPSGCNQKCSTRALHLQPSCSLPSLGLRQAEAAAAAAVSDSRPEETVLLV